MEDKKVIHRQKGIQCSNTCRVSPKVLPINPFCHSFLSRGLSGIRTRVDGFIAPLYPTTLLKIETFKYFNYLIIT